MEKNDIEYVANLSRLKLSESEQEIFTDQLSKIFDYINKLNELDTNDVVPMTNAIDVNNIFRKDIEVFSISKKDALSNSPAKNPQFFKVPQVLE